jgi:hypothetical protein
MESDMPGAAAEVQHTGMGVATHESRELRQVFPLRMHGAAQVGGSLCPELADDMVVMVT